MRHLLQRLVTGCSMTRTAACTLLFAGVLLLQAIGAIGCDRADTGSSGSGGGGSADRLKLGFVVKQPEEPWFQLEWQFAGQAADRLGFDLVKIAAPDGDKVLSAIDNLASQGAEGFVICTPDVKLGPAIVAQAKSRDLKVIAVDDQFIGTDGKPMTDVPYLGISARKIGNQVGQALWDEMKKRDWPADGTAVCVVTFDELDTARERTDGVVETLAAAGFPKDKMYRAPQRTSDVPGALDAVTVLLTQRPEVKRWLVCGMNDSAVIGAVRATEGRQIPPDNVIGIGINGTDCVSEFEKSQPTGFFASVLLSPRTHGAETIEMLHRWVKDGQEPPKDTRTTGILIDRSNYKQVRQEQGITG